MPFFLCILAMIATACASKKSSKDDTTSATSASLTYATCANGQTSGSVFTQNSSGVVHNHTGTACLHCHDPGLQLDINEDRKASKTAPAYSLAGTLYATNQAAGALPSATDPAVATGEIVIFKDFTNTSQIATATTDCSGNFWVKASDDTRNMPQYYNGGSGAVGTATISTTTGGISALNLTAGGTCQGTPAVTTTGGGCTTQPTGTALMNGTSVAAVVVANSGKGCTSAPTSVNFTLNCSVTPTATATLAGGKITAVNLSTGGTCTANSIPSVSITGLTGCTTQPVLQAVMSGTGVSQLVILDQGAGCGGSPTVTFAASCSVAPTATATYRAGEVTGVTITSGGSGYVSGGTTVKLLGGGTNAAGAVAIHNTGVTGGAINTGALFLASGGTGYTSAPTVVVTGTTTAAKKAAAYYSTTVQSSNRTMNLRTEQGDCNSGNCHTNASATTATGIRSVFNPDPTNQGANALGTYDPTSNCASPSTTSGCYPMTPTAPYATLGNYTGVTPALPVVPFRYLGKIFK